MSALFPTYNRFNLAVAAAEGSIVTDTEGKEYLDFGSGIGVNNLGHRNPVVQKAVEEQLGKYWHVSNLYHNPIQEKVAKLLTEGSGLGCVFFGNSGAEANEAAIKLARKATGKTKIITFKQSFHGRTFATMSATGQEKIQAGFGPMLPTFDYVPFNNLALVKEAIDEKTAAIMLEVIQGEGGVIVGDVDFIKEIETLCNEKGILLIIDEIQTGIGRTGLAFGFKHYDISPDIITVAKGLGNGLPVGAMVAKEKYRHVFSAGTHGTTFGGNPLAMAAAQAVLEIVFQKEFLKTVEDKGIYLEEQLNNKLGNHSLVKGISGKGLMCGITCTEDVSSLIPKFMEKGLLILSAGPHVIRLLPPLTITKDEIDQAIEIICEVMK